MSLTSTSTSNPQMFTDTVAPPCLIANLDKKEYLRPETFGENADLYSVYTSAFGGVLTGLAVLLADGNGRGGGDLGSDSAVIGSWAGQRVCVLESGVCDPDLSEPGLESLPLYEQMLRGGKDISAEVVHAIIAGEGKHTPLSQLKPDLFIPLPQQRALLGEGLLYWQDEAARRRPFEQADALFHVMGVPYAWYPHTQLCRLQEGVNQLARWLQVTEVPTVMSVSSEKAYVPRKSSWGNLRSVHATVEMTIWLERQGQPSQKVVRFDTPDTSLNDWCHFLFGDVKLTRAPVTQGYQGSSPFVANLLKAIADKEF